MDDQAGQPRGSRKWRWLIAIAIFALLIPLVPIAAGLAITSGSQRSQTVAADTKFKPVGPATSAGTAGQAAGENGTRGGRGSATGTSGAGASSSSSGSGSGTAGSGSGTTGSGSATPGSSGSVASSGSVPGGSGSHGSASGGSGSGGGSAAAGGAIVALLRHPTTMRVDPAGRALAQIGVRTEFGSPTTFLVARQVPGWLGVISTQSGNGRLGWVERGAVSLGRVRWQLNVSLSARRLTVLEDGKVLRRYPVAIGRPAAPTPPGRFAVTDRLATHDPAGPYGCCILALSAHSPHAIQGWSGGSRIAIHSTPDSSSIGGAVSHGCVRVSLANGTWLLAHIPLGTPTVIRS